MNRLLTLLACLILAGLVFSACTAGEFPTNIPIPTQLPQLIETVVVITPPSFAQPTDAPEPTSEPTAEPVIPVTGDEPTGGMPIDTGTLIIGMIALIALVSIVAMFSMASRRRTESPDSPPRTDRPPDGP